jgi:hypothetical protein
MVDLIKLAKLRQTFADLLDDLALTWPAKGIDYVREIVGHGVYGDALENLIAIELEDGVGLSRDHVRTIEALAAMMEMEDSPWVVRLRESR